MEIKFSNEEIRFEKELNSLDNFVIKFTSILNKLSLDYVIVSGYVSIMFGRNRNSEDIDIIFRKLSYKEFLDLWTKLINNNFECIITEDPYDAFNKYLNTGHAIRFSYKDKFIPNIEIKFPKTDLDLWTLGNRNKVIMNSNILYVSKIEPQISFKLFLGSEKDIEDAKFLYYLFKDNLDYNLLNEFNKKINIEHLFNKYIKDGSSKD